MIMIMIIEGLLEEIGNSLAAVHTPLGLRLGLGRRLTVPVRSFLATGRHLGKKSGFVAAGELAWYILVTKSQLY